MKSITQLIESIKSLDEISFFLKTNLEALVLTDSLSFETASDLLSPEIIESIEESITSFKNLNNLLAPIVRKLKQQNYKSNKNTMQQYANFTIDEPPIIKSINDNKSFEEIMSDPNNGIKPVRRRTPLEYKGECKRCGAPNDYVYKHTENQHRCKACMNTFSIKQTYHEEIASFCPYCNYQLIYKRTRSHYDVFYCYNYKCSFYKKNLKNKPKDAPDQYKLHYHFRPFHFDYGHIQDLKPLSINSIVDLNKIHHSKYTLGLILTFYINYGISSRKTALIMKDIFGIKISHQTIVNYAEAAASITEELNKRFEYNLSNYISFDETYVKVRGKNHYVFFGSDTESKAITSYRIFNTRNSKDAIITLNETLSKYKEIPEDLLIVTDGNPIYNAAQLFFHMNGINFDLQQVIGVKNSDETSLLYRPYKQVIERLNRTYKENYHGKNGYNSLRMANVYNSLFVTFFNFLRVHSSLNYKTPVELDIFDEDELMPNRWIKLIDYTYNNYLTN